MIVRVWRDWIVLYLRAYDVPHHTSDPLSQHLERRWSNAPAVRKAPIIRTYYDWNARRRTRFSRTGQ